MKQPHICLDETLGIDYAILPGDPARLDRIAAQLENVRELAYNREFRSLCGEYRGVRVLALGGGALGVWLAALYGKHQLGGMSGDVSGFALTLGELAGFLCLCLL